MVFWAFWSMGMMSSSHGCGKCEEYKLRVWELSLLLHPGFPVPHKPHLNILTRNWDLKNLNGSWCRRETISNIFWEYGVNTHEQRDLYKYVGAESHWVNAGNMMSYMHLCFLKLGKTFGCRFFFFWCKNALLFIWRSEVEKDIGVSTVLYYMWVILFFPKVFPNLPSKRE